MSGIIAQHQADNHAPKRTGADGSKYGREVPPRGRQALFCRRRFPLGRRWFGRFSRDHGRRGSFLLRRWYRFGCDHRPLPAARLHAEPLKLYQSQTVGNAAGNGAPHTATHVGSGRSQRRLVFALRLVHFELPWASSSLDPTHVIPRTAKQDKCGGNSHQSTHTSLPAPSRARADFSTSAALSSHPVPE